MFGVVFSQEHEHRALMSPSFLSCACDLILRAAVLASLLRTHNVLSGTSGREKSIVPYSIGCECLWQFFFRAASANRKKLIGRREGACNRADEPSETFCGEGEKPASQLFAARYTRRSAPQHPVRHLRSRKKVSHPREVGCDFLLATYHFLKLAWQV